MTIPTTIAASGPYYPNGATTAFPFGFKASATDEVSVVLIAADGVRTTVSPASYTVTLAGGDYPGGTVTMASAPAADGRELWVFLDPSFLQEIKFEDEGAFNQTILNQLADEAGSRSIWLRDRVSRALLMPFGETGFQIPGASGRASKAFGFDGAGAAALLSLTGSVITDAALIQFKQLGAGAVVRSLLDKAQETVSVLDFGAKGDGVTDDTAAINLAIASLSAKASATVLFPDGVYKVTGSINVTRGQITLKGDGMGATVIRCATNGVDIFKVRNPIAPGSLSNFAICDMQIDSSGYTPTGGSGLFMEKVITAIVSNVSFGNHNNSIAILGCFNVLVDNALLSHGGLASPAGRVGIYVTKASTPYGDGVAANIILSGVTGTGGGDYTNVQIPGAGYGLYVDCVDGLWVDNCYFGYYDQASAYANRAGFMISGLKFSNVWLDHSRNYGLWLNGSSGTLGASEFEAVRMVGGANAVYNAYITGAWSDVHFIGGHAEQANDHSVACVTTGSNITFTGFDCSAPTTRVSKTSLFFNGPNYTRVVGCSIDGGAVGSTLHGVYVGQGVGHVIANNTFKNCAITAKIDGTTDYWTAIGNFDATTVNTFSINNNSSGTHFFLCNVGGQSTGYGTPTGAAKVANFPGATATLVQCSNMIAQIVSELKTRGIFAA